MARTAIEPTRAQNFPEWYQGAIKVSDLACQSPVRGCMVVKPWGFALWENMKRALDDKIRQTGHENAYFPLFIPLSFFQKEANHVEGFATECAVVTHHRLEKDKDGQLQPAGELEEPLIVRPTSEMMIAEMYSQWIESHRDLPVMINQWSNVVRWEMRTRMFLRTAEILWQEGHTAHATKEEAVEEAQQMIRVYADFAKDYLALPFIIGEKTESERFPGADCTYTIEGMMQDGKALQAGTSHFLGQNFAKASDITFMSKEGNLEHVWMTSWGVTTRLIGAIIMTHGDDDGLRLPPRVASSQIVIIPFIQNEESRDDIERYCDALAGDLRQIEYFGNTLSVKVDHRDMRGGEKGWDWIKKGVPLRIEVGKKEIESNTLTVKWRTRGHKDAEKLDRETVLRTVADKLESIHQTLFADASKFLKENTTLIDSKEDFYAHFKKEGTGFVLAHWNGSGEIEAQVKKDLGVTIRCIPKDTVDGKGVCIFTGEPSEKRVIFAKAY